MIVQLLGFGPIKNKIIKFLCYKENYLANLQYAMREVAIASQRRNPSIMNLINHDGFRLHLYLSYKDYSFFDTTLKVSHLISDNEPLLNLNFIPYYRAS